MLENVELEVRDGDAGLRTQAGVPVLEGKAISNIAELFGTVALGYELQSKQGASWSGGQFLSSNS